MDFVTLDSLGRILLPKSLRQQLGLQPGDRLLAVPSEGRLLLAAVDVDELARKMHTELAGVDLADLARRARSEANRDAASSIEDVLAGRQRGRGRHAKASRRVREPARNSPDGRTL